MASITFTEDIVMEDPEQLLVRELDRFKTSLTELQSERFLSTSLRDVKNFIITVQRDQEGKKSLMNFSRLQSFLTAMSQFVEVCEALNLGRPELSCYIWGPSRFILGLANELNTALDATLEYYFDLGKRMPLLGPHRIMLQSCAPLRTLIVQMYIDLLEFHSRMLKLFAERNWKRTYVAISNDYRKSFLKSLDRFDCHRKLLDDVISQQGMFIIDDTAERLSEHIQRYESDQHDIQMLVRTYGEDRQKILESIEKQEQDRKNETRLAIMRWLSDEVDENRYQKRCDEIRSGFPNTGSWILKDQKVEDWLESETPASSVLWVRGKMGAGKTILASHIIDYLTTQKPDSKTSYYYCSGSDAKGINCLSLYKSLLRQFIHHNEDLLPVFQQRKSRDKEVLIDEGVAKKLVELCCDTSLQQFIVIDGLDEFSDRERQQVTKSLVDIVEKNENDHITGKIRVLFMSQDLKDMRHELSSAGILDLPAKAVQSDIENFVDLRLETLKQKWGFTDLEIRRARFLISKGADGVFLYAVLVLDNIFCQLTKGDALQELQDKNIPMDLEKAYAKIIEGLKRTHQTGWPTARKVFSWLACAKRSLALHELQGALSVFTDNGGKPNFGLDLGRLRKDIREVCGPLIYVVEGERIDFIHQTVRQFILSDESIDVRTVQCDLAFLCLNYLSLKCFDASVKDDEARDYAKKGYYAFQDYAISNWAEHFESLIAKDNSAIFEHAVKGSDYRRRGAIALENFYKLHGKDIDAAGMQEQALSLDSLSIASPEDQCRAFEPYDFHGRVVGIWKCIRRHQSKPSKERDTPNIGSLEISLKRNRKALEEVFEKPSPPTEAGAQDIILSTYGTRIYKCDHLRCQYFHQGFETKEIRDNHLNRHDRPFLCPVEGCSLIPFGFSTNKDMEKHVRNYHPDPDRPIFRPLDRDRPEEGKFTCQYCNKGFTRAANLEGHRNSHQGQRPFVCSICGRGFARQNDRRRHEKIHTRRPP